MCQLLEKHGEIAGEMSLDVIKEFYIVTCGTLPKGTENGL